MSKIVKFKKKPRKGGVKRIKLSGAKDSENVKMLTKRINVAHRLIKKSRERKLKANTDTVLSSHNKSILNCLN